MSIQSKTIHGDGQELGDTYVEEKVQKYLVCSQFRHHNVELLILTIKFPDYPDLFMWKMDFITRPDNPIYSQSNMKE